MTIVKEHPTCVVDGTMQQPEVRMVSRVPEITNVLTACIVDILLWARPPQITILFFWRRRSSLQGGLHLPEALRLVLGAGSHWQTRHKPSPGLP